jgi:hypothetical protein
MKKLKSLKLMLLALVAMVSSSAFAQRNVGEKFPEGNFIYEVTKKMGSKPGEVKIVAIRDGKNPVKNDSLKLVGYLETKVFEDTYKFNVIYADNGALQQTATTDGAALTVTGEAPAKASAKKVVIPKEFTQIKAHCFEGYTNIDEIKFEEGSLVNDIQNNAFITTQIAKFDFTPCSKLAALNDEVFVEAGKKNSFITEITLPENSTLLKNIEGAFKNLPNLTKIVNLEKSSITKIVDGAFENDAKLTSLTLPGTVKYIESGAFKGSGIATLNIDVTSIIYIGVDHADPYDPANHGNVYGNVVDDQKKLKTLKLTGNLGGVVLNGAFNGCKEMTTLDLEDLTFISGGQFATNSFKDCDNVASVTIKAINDTPSAPYEFTIADDAFEDCDVLKTVEIKSINSANAIGTAAFGNKLQTVTIGTVKAGALSIKAGAFVYQKITNTVLNLATGTGEYLSSDDAFTNIIAANAFDFTAVTGLAPGEKYPSVNIGEIKSKGGVFAAAAITCPFGLAELNFKGDIAQNGLDVFILSHNDAISTINFFGTIATGGIATNAFAGLAPVMTLYFKGELKEKAIARGAFQGLLANSKIYYQATTIADKTVNPFDKQAFDAGSTADAARIILLMQVADPTLEANFKDTDKSDNSLFPLYPGDGLQTNGDFDIYLVKWDDTPVVIPADWTFTAYQDKKNNKSVAWARYEFGAKALNSTVAPGADLRIQRVQNSYKKQDGTTVAGTIKVTIYGTYTEEDEFNKKSTVYMVPLKAQGGYYYIPGTNAETLIAKVELKNAEFTDSIVKIAVSNIAGASSIWGNLRNDELFVASNMMTNQQLFDKNAVDGATNIAVMKGTGADAIGDGLWSGIALDASGAFHAERTCAGVGGLNIYRHETNVSDNTKIVEDLYTMRNPAAFRGFDIVKTTIVKGGAYINTGWYYMLLKKYTDGPTYAPYLVWLDDASDSEITAILQTKSDIKNNAGNNAIYTLQGIRVSQTQKGQIYIMNGKKFIAK